MKKDTTSAAISAAAIVEDALQDVRASFERFCLTAGIATLASMMEEDAVRLCGPRYGRGLGKDGHRWGETKGKVGFHGGKVEIDRPRVRARDGGELPLPSWEAAVAEDLLGHCALNLMLINVSTRRFGRAVRLPGGDVPATKGAGVSKSAVSPSAGRTYGLARVTHCWNVSRATVYRHRQEAPAPKRRPGHLGPCDDATLLAHIKQAIAESRFTGEGYRKIWARLRMAGIRSSPGRVRRVMRENGLLAPHRVRKGPDKAHDGTITTDAVNVLWGTDMTQTITVAEGVAQVFVAVDHCNSECVGIHADKSANRFQALEPVHQGVREHFAAIGKDVAVGLKLRHDHGPNYMADDFQDQIAFLGIEASPSFVREPEGNSVAERFIRTLKENLLWVRQFETIEELRLALLEFAAWYNTHWLVARHGYRTPARIRADQQPAMDQAA